MAAETPMKVVVVGPTTAKAPPPGPIGGLYERLVGADDTGGAFDASLITQPPGIATPLHVHTHEAEAFYVLQGTLDYQAGEELHHSSAGSFIYPPRGVPLAFSDHRNDTRSLSRTRRSRPAAALRRSRYACD